MKSFEGDYEIAILKKILNTLPSSVYIKDINGRYVWLNKKSIEQVTYKHLIPESIIGKTDLEVFPEVDAIELAKNDRMVMETQKGICVEENVILPNGEKLIQLSFKEPLYDENDTHLIGVLGYTLEITELRKKQDEITQLKLENESLKDQEKFAKLANQVVHDIRSPLASLLMIVKSCTGIPEAERIALREAAVSIGDIANNLLSQYQKKATDIPSQLEKPQSILVSAVLMQLLTDKKYQYRDLPIKFDHHINATSYFAFIKVEPSSFKRMISNLINNAVDAFEDKTGTIILKLDADNSQVKVIIQDDGKGIPQELLKKIQSNVAVTYGKQSGHGIGLTQVREAIERNQGHFHIDSKVGFGSSVTLTFSRIMAPNWIAEEIVLQNDDIVVILDDDPSIHRAWDSRFDSILREQNFECPKIKIVHFHIGIEALNFLQGLSNTELEKVFLLTDFELLKQEINGLEVIAKSRVKRSTLVTSHFAELKLQEEIVNLGAKILPKQLASEVIIQLHDPTSQNEICNQNATKTVDAVIVDDDVNFVKNLTLFVFEDIEVDTYDNPEQFLKNIKQYPFNVKIYMDNNYSTSNKKGLDIAKQLHQLGYNRLYLLSGETFDKSEIPHFLTVIRKDDVENIRNS
ncbi:MAG: PAS domain-containing sensor histidine kinase [Gammaproteobacteria bacterium]